MKQIQVTRKVKEQLAEHFRKGGLPSNLPPALQAVPDGAVLAAFELHTTQKVKRRTEFIIN